eukprot:GCRY01001896.1.p1 GENE.GCRY01001896.1~~GCRY01001896.1.p1  ORF type:complete len:906 (+),score=321.55 GCRY01001896.1:213-2930(+)
MKRTISTASSVKSNRSGNGEDDFRSVFSEGSVNAMTSYDFEVEGESFTLSTKSAKEYKHNFWNHFDNERLEKRFRKHHLASHMAGMKHSYMAFLCIYYGFFLMMLAVGELSSMAYNAPLIVYITMVYVLIFKFGIGVDSWEMHAALTCFLCQTVMVIQRLDLIFDTHNYEEEVSFDAIMAIYTVTYSIAGMLYWHTLIRTTLIVMFSNLIITFICFGIKGINIWSEEEDRILTTPVLISLAFFLLGFSMRELDMLSRNQFINEFRKELQKRQLQKKIGDMRLKVHDSSDIDDETRSYILNNFDHKAADNRHLKSSVNGRQLRSARSLNLQHTPSALSKSAAGAGLFVSGPHTANLSPAPSMAGFNTHLHLLSVSDKPVFDYLDSDMLRVDLFSLQPSMKTPKEQSNDSVLQMAGKYVMESHHLYEEVGVDIQKWVKLLGIVNKGYKSTNAYHNQIHAAEMTLLLNRNLAIMDSHVDMQLTALELFAVLYSGLIHDLGHPGRNNNFLSKTYHEIAMVYNDRSVLENWHVSKGLQLLAEPETNIIGGFSTADVKYFRKLSIDLVLATDMQYHFDFMSQLDEKINGKGINVATSVEDRIQMLSMAFKLADVGHVFKSQNITVEWTRRVNIEFLGQGDDEKDLGLEVSPFCDRESVDIPKGQVGFLEFVIRPLLRLWMECCQDEGLDSALQSNIAYWKTLQEQGEKFHVRGAYDLGEGQFSEKTPSVPLKEPTPSGNPSIHELSHSGAIGQPASTSGMSLSIPTQITVPRTPANAATSPSSGILHQDSAPVPHNRKAEKDSSLLSFNLDNITSVSPSTSPRNGAVDTKGSAYAPPPPEYSHTNPAITMGEVSGGEDGGLGLDRSLGAEAMGGLAVSIRVPPASPGTHPADEFGADYDSLDDTDSGSGMV